MNNIENKDKPKRKAKLYSMVSIRPKTNLPCSNIYPVIGSRIEKLEDLKTVAIILTKEEAIGLARNLLLASQEWDVSVLTAYRNTHQMTVTHHGYEYDK